jgi:hypothetical protein
MTTHLLLFFLKGSCESSIEFVTGAHSAHSDHSRTNPGEIGGHLKTQVPNGAQCRSNAGDRASLALAKLACRWHLDHGEGVPRALCAGCRAPIDDAAALDLADGNLVHFDPDYRCLIAFGERWRTTARAAVGAASTDGQTGATGLR